MRHNFLRLIFIACLFPFINSCKKEIQDPILPPFPEPEEFLVDDIDEVDVDFWAAQPDTTVNLEDVLLDNGVSVKAYLDANDPTFMQNLPNGRVSSPHSGSPAKEEQRRLFLSRMLAVGDYLVNDVNHTHPSEGANAPAQTGLAYLWGGKNYTARESSYPYIKIKPGPPKDTVFAGCTSSLLYGLDCSGFIYTVTTRAFLPPVVPPGLFSVSGVKDVVKWNDAFRNSGTYDSLIMYDVGQLPPNMLRNGDFIFWPGHIGVVVGGAIYQSNGTPDSSKCANNTLTTAGPRALSLTQSTINGYGKSYTIFRVIFSAGACSAAIDSDGNSYQTQRIGNQCWMAENLKTGRFNDGTLIPEINDDAEWVEAGLGSAAWCYYDNDFSYELIFGRLYNHYAVANASSACPDGYRLPTRQDFITLAAFLGGESVAGGKMKDEDLWDSPNTGATDLSGFGGLPGGLRFYQDGQFLQMGQNASFWTIDGVGLQQAFGRSLIFNSSGFIEFNVDKGYGFSVRCIEDI